MAVFSPQYAYYFCVAHLSSSTFILTINLACQWSFSCFHYINTHSLHWLLCQSFASATDTYLDRWALTFASGVNPSKSTVHFFLNCRSWRRLLALHDQQICQYNWLTLATNKSTHRVGCLSWGHLCLFGIQSRVVSSICHTFVLLCGRPINASLNSSEPRDGINFSN